MFSNYTEVKSKTGHESLNTRDAAMIALCAAVMAVCSWISIPAAVPFTMQTFGVFLAVGLLGGRNGTLAVLIYILLGAAGLPVFSGYAGGAAKLAGPTGGYLIGFLFMIPIAGAFRRRYADRPVLTGCGMLLGLAAAYFFGTAWFVYQMHVSVRYALSVCVLPFIPFDLIKIVLAVLAGSAVRKALLRAGISCE